MKLIANRRRPLGLIAAYRSTYMDAETWPCCILFSHRADRSPLIESWEALLLFDEDLNQREALKGHNDFSSRTKIVFGKNTRPVITENHYQTVCSSNSYMHLATPTPSCRTVLGNGRSRGSPTTRYDQGSSPKWCPSAARRKSPGSWMVAERQNERRSENTQGITDVCRALGRQENRKNDIGRASDAQVPSRIPRRAGRWWGAGQDLAGARISESVQSAGSVPSPSWRNVVGGSWRSGACARLRWTGSMEGLQMSEADQKSSRVFHGSPGCRRRAMACRGALIVGYKNGPLTPDEVGRHLG